jgi:hypothetical protein
MCLPIIPLGLSQIFLAKGADKYWGIIIEQFKGITIYFAGLLQEIILSGAGKDLRFVLFFANSR